MGLDITAYRRLTPAPDAAVDTSGHPTDWKTFVRLHPTVLALTKKEWPGRTEGLAVGVFSYAEAYGFRAGSYGGYNEWRDDLAKLAGYSSAKHCWTMPDPAKPFLELINFSDCEGYIGPVVAAKLAADFTAYADNASAGWFGDRYVNWHKAFEMAADAGCVEFH